MTTLSEPLRAILLDAMARSAIQGTLTLYGAADQVLGTVVIRDTVIADRAVKLIVPDMRITQGGRALRWTLTDPAGHHLFQGETSELGWQAPVVEPEDRMEFTDLEVRLP